MPALQKVLFVYDVTDQYTVLELKGYREAARQLGLVLVERPVRTRAEAQATLGALRRRDVDGLLGPWATSLNIPGYVLETAARLGLPSMFSEPWFVDHGLLGSYSADLHSSGRHAARLVDKILRGPRRRTFRSEIDDHIYFALNLKTARTLRIDIPLETIRRAEPHIRVAMAQRAPPPLRTRPRRAFGGHHSLWTTLGELSPTPPEHQIPSGRGRGAIWCAHHCARGLPKLPHSVQSGPTLFAPPGPPMSLLVDTLGRSNAWS